MAESIEKTTISFYNGLYEGGLVGCIYFIFLKKGSSCEYNTLVKRQNREEYNNIII